MSAFDFDDVQVIVNWRPLDISKPPACSGVYAITDTRMQTWFYIGKSINIGKRIQAKTHPVQIAKDSNTIYKYLYAVVPVGQEGWIEGRLIKWLNPEWNGATSWESASAGPSCNVTIMSPALELAMLRAIGP